MEINKQLEHNRPGLVSPRYFFFFLILIAIDLILVLVVWLKLLWTVEIFQELDRRFHT